MRAHQLPNIFYNVNVKIHQLNLFSRHYIQTKEEK
jgi:hypothetical protein